MVLFIIDSIAKVTLKTYGFFKTMHACIITTFIIMRFYCTEKEQFWN